MGNPWKIVGQGGQVIPRTGEKKLQFIDLDHSNGISDADFNVEDNRLIVNRMDLLTKDDFISLTEILIQKLTAKQVPI